MLQAYIASELLVENAPGPRLRFLRALRHKDATDADLRHVMSYILGVGFDKKAFYLSCETLARTGALYITARDLRQEPSRIVIGENFKAAQEAFGMFFEDAKTQYCAEKRLIDLKWMMLVENDQGETVGVTERARKLYEVDDVGKLGMITHAGAFQEGVRLVRMQTMPSLRDEPYRSLEDRSKDLAPERVLSTKNIQALITRTERFWKERVQNKAESSLYSCAMEQCFFETLHRLALVDGAVTWSSATEFTVNDVNVWYEGIKHFCGHRASDAAITWVRLLGWASTDNTVPPPRRTARPSIMALICPTYRKLSSTERRDLVLFNTIVKNSRTVFISAKQ
jgi:hypothetical protein